MNELYHYGHYGIYGTEENRGLERFQRRMRLREGSRARAAAIRRSADQTEGLR